MAEFAGQKKPNRDDKIHFTVVVNGATTKVKAREQERLERIIPEALRETNNAGQPVENWELRDEAGKLLDITKKIGTFGFADRVRLFLNLKAGVGGQS